VFRFLAQRPAGLAKAEEVEGVGAELATEDLDRIAPQRPRAEPAMQQQDRAPAPIGFVMDDPGIGNQ